MSDTENQEPNQDSAAEGAQPGAVPLGPVLPSLRIDSIDTLRGVAVLGILVINIWTFALPDAALFNPTVLNGLTGLDLFAWKFSYLFFLQKMMAIFSMLFGAGVVLMTQRAEARGQSIGKTYYRRILWLLVFGLVHAYFIWFGDILVSYALCGLLLYPFRKKSPRALLIIGAIVYLIGVPIMLGSGAAMGWMRDTALEAQTIEAAGGELTSMQESMLEAWDEIAIYFNPTEEQINGQIETYRGSYSEIFRHRAPLSLALQTQTFIFFFLWRLLGLMLIGMGLMKLGFFAATRSLKLYTIMGVLCYAIGLPMVGLGIERLLSHDFDVVHKFTSDGLYNYVGSIIVALGHVCVVMICCKLGHWAWLRRRLATVGRMAFSNYIFHSVVFTTIFYGYGLALFARLDYFALWGFVLGMWLLQLAISPIWLRHFRFGPLEWLWRSLTYLKWQPFRQRQSAAGQ
jgi:uncharacterized protein